MACINVMCMLSFPCSRRPTHRRISVAYEIAEAGGPFGLKLLLRGEKCYVVLANSILYSWQFLDGEKKKKTSKIYVAIRTEFHCNQDVATKGGNQKHVCCRVRAGKKSTAGKNSTQDILVI